jgi:hypothetical protein
MIPGLPGGRWPKALRMPLMADVGDCVVAFVSMLSCFFDELVKGDVGKEPRMGVAGRTLTLAWGLRATNLPEPLVGDVTLALVLEMLDAFDRLCGWGAWIDRIDDTLELVLFLPLNPELRRYDLDRGVSGLGESETRGAPCVPPGPVPE